MVNIGGSFDSKTVDPRTAYEPVENGWYAMIITDTSAQSARDNKSKHIKFEFTFDERYHPSLKGRKIFENLNLWHPNPQTVKIASATLSSIARATGVLVFSDTNALHGHSLAVKLRTSKGDDKYEPSNRPSDYDTVQNRAASLVGAAGSAPSGSVAAPPSTAAQPPQSAPSNPPAQSDVPPWMR